MEPNDPKLIELVFKVLRPARIIGLELARRGQGLTEEEVASAVSERLKVFEAGFSPEREFMAVANWLGRIQSINRIDQTPLPRCNDNAAEVGVPDLLCVASVNGSRLPLLIEVKRSDEPKLVWSEKYISQLRAYAEMLHMPLLLAWKHHHIWTLTDVRHFTKKVTSYHLDFRKAMMENLMSLIFGDIMLELTQRVAFSWMLKSWRLRGLFLLSRDRLRKVGTIWTFLRRPARSFQVHTGWKFAE